MELYRYLKSNRTLLLLVAIACILVVFPLVDGHGLGQGAFHLLFLIFLLAGIFHLHHWPKTTWVTIGFGAIAGTLECIAMLVDLPFSLIVTGQVITILFFAITEVILIAYVLTGKTITSDKIYAAMASYMIVGIMMARIFEYIEILSPGSFNIDSGLSGGVDLTLYDFLYFSFVTLTTLGYGDMTPATALARSCVIIESVFGVFFVTVFVARLVVGSCTIRSKT